MSRFMNITAQIADGENVFETTLSLHPFYIMAYMEVHMDYTTVDGESGGGPGVRVYMKSGIVFDIVIPKEKFEEMIKSTM